MTDHRDTDHSELDELASAVHDGEATAAEAARSDEPVVAARAAEFAALSQAIGATVDPAPAERREAAIAAAIAATERWGEPGQDDDAEPPLDPAAGDELADRRMARARGTPRWLPAVAAVAGVVAIFGLLALTAEGGSQNDQNQTAAVGSGNDGDGAEGDATLSNPADRAGGEATEGATNDASTESAFALGLGDLGTFTTVDALADAARSALRPAPAPTTTIGGAASGGADAPIDTASCAELAARDSGGGVVLSGTAVLDGVQVIVIVIDGETVDRLVVFTADGSCAVVADQFF